MSQNAIFHFFLYLFAYSLWQQVRFCTVPFGSETSLKSEIDYQCFILRVIDHYCLFQNGRRKIHDFSWNVLLNMVFLNFACQTRCGCLILICYVCSSIYKYCNFIFTKESKMAARKWSNFTFFANILGAYMLHSVRKLPRSVSFGSDTPRSNDISHIAVE